MNDYKTLIGITIGPIHEIMKHSKKTRELWFGSYLFSMLMKNIYEKLETKNYSFLKPFKDNSSNLGALPVTTAGLFPDRIVARTDKEIYVVSNEINEIIKQTNKNFIKIINDLITAEAARKVNSNPSVILLKNALQLTDTIVNDYLKIDFVAIPANGIEENNIVGEIEKYLDAIDVNRSFSLGENLPTCFRCKSLPAIVEVYEQFNTPANEKQKLCPFCFIKLRSHHSKAIQDLTGISPAKPFPSISEISAVELKEKYQKLFMNQDDEIDFNNFPNDGSVKNYHKYYALFMADGDNLSSTASLLKTPEFLSKCLFEFGNEVHRITENDYKGKLIYMGGDDIFTLMPFAFKERNNIKTILDYAFQINKFYKDLVTNQIEGSTTSLSIGIVIAYYKFPLSIAIEEVYEQLFNNAKNIPNKNGLAVKFIQHSGADSSFKIRLDNPNLALILDIYKNVLLTDDHFPGVHHKLKKYEKVLPNLMSDRQIDVFFEKRINEGFKNDEQKTLFLELIKSSFRKSKSEIEEELDKVGNILHVLKFLKGDE